MFKPKYEITDTILKNIAKISEIKNLIENTMILPEREVFLRKTAVAKMAHSSTSIEGNLLKQHEVEAIQAGKKINAEEKQVIEVKNYLKALKQIDLLSENKKDFSVKDTKKIHGIVMQNLINQEKKGEFRKNQVYIVNILNGIEEIAYTPPQSKDVEGYINELFEWLKINNLHSIIKAGIFHYQFESIHPFVDGNGRTGRLLTLLNLYQSGFQFKKILVLEDYYNSNRKKYYESLQTGKTFKKRADSDLTSWLEYFVEGFLFEVLKVKDQVLSLKGLSSKTDTIKFLSKDQIKIVDFILTLGKITSDDVVDILDIPKRTAQNKLKNMVSGKTIKKMGKGPNTFYILP